MRFNMASRKAVFFSALMALLFTSPLSAQDTVFTNIVAFGDSLSDNGNLFRFTNGEIPNSDYFDGRFSNGPVWVEYLATHLGAELDDFAYGGASTSGFFPPSLSAQIALWQAQGNPAQGLFSVWAGANDYLRLGSTDAQGAVGNILAGLETLASSGVTRILLPNLPDLGLTPNLLSESAETQAEASAYSSDFNQGISEALVSFSEGHPGVVIYFLDVYGLFGALATEPERFGFQNATDISPNFGVDFENGGEYVFWDDVHPTTEAHAFLAQEAASLLSKDCAKVNADLSLNLFLVEYGGMRFGFTLNYIGGIPGDPGGFYWEMNLATLGVESDNILGIDHVVAGDALNLIVPCAEYAGSRFAFSLDFVQDSGAGALLWRMDLPSLMVK
jgi:phospholipase/lecithinase/hemolysin